MTRVDGSAAVLADDDRGLEHLGELHEGGRRTGRADPAADVDERLARGRQQLRGTIDRGLVRLRRRVPDPIGDRHRRPGVQDVHGHLDRHRPRPARPQLPEGLLDEPGNLLGRLRKSRPLGQAGQDAALVRDLMEGAVALPDHGAVDLAADQQDGGVRRVRGGQPGGRVEHPRSGDDHGHPLPAGRTGVAVGHIGRRLLVPGAREGEFVRPLVQRVRRAVELDPGDPEDLRHALTYQRLGEDVSSGPLLRHVRHRSTHPSSNTTTCLLGRTRSSASPGWGTPDSSIPSSSSPSRTRTLSPPRSTSTLTALPT